MLLLIVLSNNLGTVVKSIFCVLFSLSSYLGTLNAANAFGCDANTLT